MMKMKPNLGTKTEIPSHKLDIMRMIIYVIDCCCGMENDLIYTYKNNTYVLQKTSGCVPCAGMSIFKNN